MTYEADLLVSARASLKDAEAVAQRFRVAVQELERFGLPHLELRFDGAGLDEVVGRGVNVHLEDMGGHWCLLIDGPDGRHLNISIRSAKAIVVDANGPVISNQGGSNAGKPVKAGRTAMVAVKPKKKRTT